jgi:hypothetical protein
MVNLCIVPYTNRAYMIYEFCYAGEELDTHGRSKRNEGNPRGI